MWIETDNYIGPCRRGLKKLRLIDRRRGVLSERDPSLAALLRQLRASAQDLSTPVHRRRFKLRLVATIAMARRVQQNATALHLVKLDGIMDDRALSNLRSIDVIERALGQAAEAMTAR
jgi:hypothetical protein